MSSRVRSLLRIAGSALALALLIFLLSQQGWDEILAALRRIPAGRLALALALVTGSRLAVAGRWYALLRHSGAGISAGQSVRLTFAGLFATNFLPTTVGGDVVRLIGALQFGSDRAVCAASLLVDRLVGMAAMAAALPLGVPQLLDWAADRGPAGGAIVLAAAGPSPIPAPGRLGALQARAGRLLQQLAAALAMWLKQPGALLTSLLFSWTHMLCKFTAIGLLLVSMGQGIPLWRIAGLWSLTYFVTLLPISINGLGVQEVSTTFFFSNLGGITLESSLTLALLIRTMEMLASLPGALFLPAILAGREPVSER